MQQALFEEKKYPPKSIFKSACQKHIRRGNVDAALRCAKANIDQDAHDFARRVMVLAPEEVSIHPLMVEMPEIITRLGKKGEKATKNDIDTMLTIVRDLALTQKRDLFEYKDLPKFTLTKEIFDYLQPWQQDIIKACKFRGDIGGMLNIFAYEGITPHDKKIFDYCHKELVPIWSDVVEWYISKYDF